jgi:hypothetical protein
MELVAATPSPVLAVPSDLSHAHPEFDGLISLISTRINAKDIIQEQSNSALVVRQDMGYVYAAWNPLFPDLIKIGATMRAFPVIRIDELSSWAGVQEPFQLVASITTPDPFALEREIHKHFDAVRKYGRKKEFFLVSKEEVGYHFHVRSLQVQQMAAGRELQKDTKTKNQKHSKYFDNKGEEVAFQNAISSFLGTYIQVNEQAFLSTEEIQESFSKHTGRTPNTQLFRKHLRGQMRATFPKANPGVLKQTRGYHGIFSIFPK